MVNWRSSTGTVGRGRHLYLPLVFALRTPRIAERLVGSPTAFKRESVRHLIVCRVYGERSGLQGKMRLPLVLLATAIWPGWFERAALVNKGASRECCGEGWWNGRSKKLHTAMIPITAAERSVIGSDVLMWTKRWGANTFIYSYIHTDRRLWRLRNLTFFVIAFRQSRFFQLRCDFNFKDIRYPEQWIRKGWLMIY